jgi:hypothetical protein
MTNGKTLVWREGTDPIFGRAFTLEGLTGKDESGGARRNPSGGFVAMAFIKGRYLSHNGKTIFKAMDRLNSEICKLSISLFGVDDLEFQIIRK